MVYPRDTKFRVSGSFYIHKRNTSKVKNSVLGSRKDDVRVSIKVLFKSFIRFKSKSSFQSETYTFSNV